jgi:hypothetical protein
VHVDIASVVNNQIVCFPLSFVSVEALNLSELEIYSIHIGDFSFLLKENTFFSITNTSQLFIGSYPEDNTLDVSKNQKQEKSTHRTPLIWRPQAPYQGSTVGGLLTVSPPE